MEDKDIEKKEKPKKSFKKKLRKYIWGTIFVTNVIVILMLLGATLAWNFLPSEVPLFAYLGMAFPVLIIINVIYLIFWILTLKWKYALVQVLVFLLCWSPLETYMPMKERETNIPENSFKLLSYNVRHFNFLMGKEALSNPIFSYILDQKPDIICFQEFQVAHEKTENGIISRGELEDIFKDYPYRSYVRLGFTPNLFGITVLSKFPIIKTKVMPFASASNGCAFHELKIRDKRVTLVNTHLESNRITGDDKKLYERFLKKRDKKTFAEVSSNIQSRLSVAFAVREDQAKMVQDSLKKEDTDAVIICGDFNDTPISYTYKTMKGDLIDAFVATGRGVGITYHEKMFLFRIDYIFHSINLKSYNMTVGEEKYSDHYPVWTDFVFK